MAFTFIALVTGTANGAGTTLDASSALNVAASDLLIAWCKSEASTSYAVAKNAGSPANTFTFDVGDFVSSGGVADSFGYVLSAAADATATFRVTTSSSSFRRFFVLQYRPDAGETVTKDTSNVGTGAGTAAASGVITTTGTDEVVVGGTGLGTGTDGSSQLINAVAATEPAGAPLSVDTDVWYRILTATFAGGTASVTLAQSVAWICNVIAFKSVAAGGAAGTSGWRVRPEGADGDRRAFGGVVVA